jgi:hypothetical protein
MVVMAPKSRSVVPRRVRVVSDESDEESPPKQISKPKDIGKRGKKRQITPNKEGRIKPKDTGKKGEKKRHKEGPDQHLDQGDSDFPEKHPTPTSHTPQPDLRDNPEFQRQLALLVQQYTPR